MSQKGINENALGAATQKSPYKTVPIGMSPRMKAFANFSLRRIFRGVLIFWKQIREMNCALIDLISSRETHLLNQPTC